MQKTNPNPRPTVSLSKVHIDSLLICAYLVHVMVLKGFSQINLLTPSFFYCLFYPSPHFSSASIKPPDPQPNGARDLGQGAPPPLYPLNTDARQAGHLYARVRGTRDSPRTGQPSVPQNSGTQRHNGPTHTNGLQRSSIQNNNLYQHNGIDNPAFTHEDAHNANALPNPQQQNPNILIQAGPTQGGAQPAAVQVSLNTLPQTAQHNNNAQMPTIHVNLNSYSTNGQQTQQQSSLPPIRATNNDAPETHENWTHAEEPNPGLRSGRFYPGDPRLNERLEAGRHGQPGLIPSGYTHHNSTNTLQRNANTQTYQQEPEPPRRSERNLARHDTAASSSRQQMPWDRLRGTPSYPSGTLQRGQSSPEISNPSDYTSQPRTWQERITNRSQPWPQSQTVSRGGDPPRQDAPSVSRPTRSRSADLLVPNTHDVRQLEATHPSQRHPHTQRESAQQDIRGSPSSQNAPRQGATHSNNPQARSLMSQQASVGHSAALQGPMAQQGPTALQAADTRALADPNHLPQAHMAQQHRAATIQKPPQGRGTQTQPVINGAKQTRQGGMAPVQHSPPQPHSNNLTQAALKSHTERAQTFQNRKQQTQAALLHPGPQVQVPAAEARHPPTPPPAIPLAEFHTLPKKHTQHKSPTRGPQAPRPPVNMPVAQRPQQARQRPNTQHHPATMPAVSRHHAGNGHVHGGAHRHAHAHAHANGHGHSAHFTHPRQVSQPHKPHDY